MSALKLGVKGGIFVGALILLSACSSEDLTQNTYKKENESVEVIPEKTKYIIKAEATNIENRT